MPLGPGKYDSEAQRLQSELACSGVFPIVVGGDRGSGFSIVAMAEVARLAPAFLRDMADEIEKSSGSAEA